MWDMPARVHHYYLVDHLFIFLVYALAEPNILSVHHLPRYHY